MRSAAFIDEASEWASVLVLRESRGPGDTENARRRVSDRLGVLYATLWGLQYRKPKTLEVSIYMRLRAAHEAFKARGKRAADGEAAKLAAVYTALAARLETTDAAFFGGDVAALLDLARRLGAPAAG